MPDTGPNDESRRATRWVLTQGLLQLGLAVATLLAGIMLSEQGSIIWLVVLGVVAVLVAIKGCASTAAAVRLLLGRGKG